MLGIDGLLDGPENEAHLGTRRSFAAESSVAGPAAARQEPAALRIGSAQQRLGGNVQAQERDPAGVTLARIVREVPKLGRGNLTGLWCKAFLSRSSVQAEGLQNGHLRGR